MEKKERIQEKGITLISLVITIIVLLILAAVTIGMLFGENGLIKKGYSSKEKTEIAEYQEQIDLAKAEQNIDTDRGKSKEEILDEVKDIIEKNDKFKDATIEKYYQNKENPKLVITTKEGYVYEVYADRTEYKGMIGKDIEEGDIELEITVTNADIKYTYDPNGWTNGEVQVGIEIKKEEYKNEGYEIEYSYNATSWEKYTGKITAEKNKAIYTRLKKGLAIGKGFATGNVINIDTNKPTIDEELSKTDITTKGFTLNVTVTDSESGLAKIVWKYKKDGAESYTEVTSSYKDLHSEQAGEKNQTTKTIAITDLTSGTYKAKAEIFDVAGNSEETTEITIQTGTVQTPGTATCTPSGKWTNGKVTVTLPMLEGFTTRYTIDGNAPTITSTEYKAPFEVSANCTVKYIYTDGVNIGGAGTANIQNIDTGVPTIGSATGSTTTGNTGTIKVTSIADTGGSGLKGIYISTNSTKPAANATTGWESNTGATYTKTVTANGTYNVWVKDGAGNVSNVKTCTVSGIVAKVTKVTLTGATVEEGKTVTIQPTLEGSQSYKTIEFTSSSTGTATINATSGEATGIKEGTSTITCKVTNYDGTSVSGTCTLTVKAIIKTASQITADDIGETVTNYKPTADTETQWRIFFADSSYMYLIAKDYIEIDKLPATSVGHRPDGDLPEMFPRAAEFTAVKDDYTNWASMIKENGLKNTLSTYHKWANIAANQSKTYDNIKAIGYILDTNIWTKQYGTSDAEYVIGGPTIEMFCASYNKTHPEKQLQYNENNEYGYSLKWQNDASYGYDVEGLNLTEYNNLYAIEDDTNAVSYWLGSPCGAMEVCVWEVLAADSAGIVSANSYENSVEGFRPIVCLNSSVQLKKVSGGYEIVK